MAKHQSPGTETYQINGKKWLIKRLTLKDYGNIIDLAKKTNLNINENTPVIDLLSEILKADILSDLLRIILTDGNGKMFEKEEVYEEDFKEVVKVLTGFFSSRLNLIESIFSQFTGLTQKLQKQQQDSKP